MSESLYLTQLLYQMTHTKSNAWLQACKIHKVIFLIFGVWLGLK